MDYIFILMHGLRADDYIDGSIICGNLLRNSQYDIYYLSNFFSLKLYEQPISPDNWRYYETTFFNVTGQIVNSIPDTIYECYMIPETMADMWDQHLN